MAARGLSDWSAEATDLGVEAVSADELARIRRLLLLAGRDDLARSDERKLARDLRLLTSHGKLTRAGLLVLGDAETIAAAIPNHGFSYQYRASPGSESTARTTYEWAQNKSFIKVHYTITPKKDGEQPSSGTQVIGVDPAVGQIRAWLFASDGGIGESNWVWDGDRWMIESVMPPK